MFTLKHKVLLLVIALSIGLGFVRGGVAAAAAAPGCYVVAPTGIVKSNDCGTVKKPDPTKCYKTEVVNNKTQTTEVGCDTINPEVIDTNSGPTVELDPGCYIGEGTVQTTCPSNIPAFDAAKCYRAAYGSDGKLGPYEEAACTAPANNSGENLTCASNDDGYCNFVKDYINPGIQFLAVLVGLIVTIMIIVGGIQYSAAGADHNAVAKAKKRIFNAIFALVAFGLLYAFLQYIIPGGL